MDIKKITQNRLMGRTVEILSRGLDFRSANHNVISGNLANMDTPGYKPKELVFNDALLQAMGKNSPKVKSTRSEHFSHFTGSLGNSDKPYTIRERATGKGQNKLNLDKEMAKMVQNNIQFEAYAKLLQKKFAVIKLAIEAGRR